jgi:hypothetical protein
LTFLKNKKYGFLRHNVPLTSIDVASKIMQNTTTEIKIKVFS